MIANDILLPNIHKIPDGIIITLQSIIFDFVMSSLKKKKKRKEKRKKKKKEKDIVSNVLHMCRVQCESLLCSGVPNHYIFSEGVKHTVER
jgi:hypothetical protein